MTKNHSWLTVFVIVLVVIAIPLVVTANHMTNPPSDDFEDGNADGWDLTGDAAVNNTSYNNTYSLETTMGNSSNNGWTWTDGPSYSGYEPFTVEGTLFIEGVSATGEPLANWYIGRGVYVAIQTKDNLDGTDNVDMTLKEPGGNLSGSIGIDDNKWYRFKFTFEATTTRMKWWPAGTSEPTYSNAPSFKKASISIGKNSGGQSLDGRDNGVSYSASDIRLDNITYSPQPKVSGTVTDRKDDPLNNVTITASRNGSVASSATTNETGEYVLSLPDKDLTYNLTASKSNYSTDTATVNATNSHNTRNFQLIKKVDQLSLDAPTFLEHDDTAAYVVEFRRVNNTTNEIETVDVTSNATVTSNNTTILTVDSNARELIATSDESINVVVTVNATYSTGGETYNTSQDVTVANLSLDNIDIIPGVYRVSATFADNPDAADDPTKGVNPMLAILVATLVGIVGARGSTSFGGLALMTIALVVAWFAGFVGTGMMLVAVFTATFIGLNLAGNTAVVVSGGNPGG